jgi:hypothetical protein
MVMAASNSSDIPDGITKGKYCVCNNCKISREEGRQEVRKLILDLHQPDYDGECQQCIKALDYDTYDAIYETYPCPTVRAATGLEY